MYNPLPKLPSPDNLQIVIFIIIFAFSSGSIINGWLSLSYLMNNTFILLLSLLTVIYPLSVKLHYIFGYANIISVLLDVMVIIYNFPHSSQLRVFPFILGVIYMALKIFIGLLELQTAKTLNDEPRLPIAFVGDIFDLTKSQSIQQHAQAQFSSSSSRPPQQQQPQQQQQQPNVTKSSTSTKSNQPSDTLPPYGSAAVSSGARFDAEKSYQEGYPNVHSLATTTTTTTTTNEKFTNIETTQNVDDL